MLPEIDHSLYPDTDAPESLDSEYDAAEYVQRVCGAYDFGIPPSDGVLETLRSQRTVFDKYPMPASPAYHALRRWFGWPPVSALPAPELRSEHFDRREGRELDAQLV